MNATMMISCKNLILHIISLVVIFCNILCRGHSWDPELSKILPQKNGPLTYSTPTSPYRIGDMLFSADDFVSINGTRQIKNAVSDLSRRWDNNTIPYVVDESLLEYKYMIKEAMEQYHTYTCIKFVPRTNQENYILIVSKDGCYSWVGNKRMGSQDVSLGRGCHFIGTVIHELGHAVGFYHEHDRGDRDDFIEVHWGNIDKGLEDQFEKVLPSRIQYLTPYDINSIMHYGETAFSKDGWSKTMTSKSGVTFTNPYDKQGMDDSDILRVKMLYEC